MVIEDDVWIGEGVTSLQDGTVGEGAIVSSVTVGNWDVDPSTFVAGVPVEVGGGQEWRIHRLVRGGTDFLQ